MYSIFTLQYNEFSLYQLLWLTRHMSCNQLSCLRVNTAVRVTAVPDDQLRCPYIKNVLTSSVLTKQSYRSLKHVGLLPTKSSDLLLRLETCA